MARGLKLPIQTNRKGGAELIQGSPYLAQVVRAGLTPNTSRNPFQAGGGIAIGIPEDVVFAVNDAKTMSRVRKAIKRFFSRLRRDELARLRQGAEGVSFRRPEGTGNLEADVRYIDLEADEPGEVQTNFRDALRGKSSNLGGV